MKLEPKYIKALNEIYYYLEKDEREYWYEIAEDSGIDIENLDVYTNPNIVLEHGKDLGIYYYVVLLGKLIEQCENVYQDQLNKFTTLKDQENDN
tara:strand:- start:1374 stop:1655 length:282 start_codon:yes stop_codon:yes gene_type:complete